MKKIEKKFTTDRYELVIVQHLAEQSDFVNAVEPIEIPTPYLLIGPPGSQLARFDGVDLAVLQTLIDSVNSAFYGGAGPGIMRSRRGPPICGA